jgi:hypothetical protein
LGYSGETRARLTGKALGYDVVGTFDTCETCSMEKLRQMVFSKDWTGSSVIERLFNLIQTHLEKAISIYGLSSYKAGRFLISIPTIL